MDKDFWLTKWRNNQIGFHEGAPNTLLVAHFAALGIPKGGRVFVPLCGKSRDMSWLRAQGLHIVGAELSRLAVEQFFTELGIVPGVAPAGRLECFVTEGITIFAGDIFDLDQTMLGRVDFVYDRAALVALPAPLRERYAEHLIALTRGAPQLLVTLEYDQTRLPGPPFSVSGREIEDYYGDSHRLKCLESREAPGGIKGICPAEESAWLISRG